jgi:prepilin-type processing-associated H-X9-DG protein
MDEFMNGDDDTHPYSATMRRDSDLINPGASRSFVFIDENENSIDNGQFGVYLPYEWGWVNLPTSRHSQGGTLSFADGHVEYWRWQGTSVLTFKGYPTPAPTGDPDIIKLENAVPLGQ